MITEADTCRKYVLPKLYGAERIAVIGSKPRRRPAKRADYNLYGLREGDLILQVTFAWEGAIALCSKAEHGLFGSTRYPTFRVDETRCYPPFLVRHLGTYA